LLRLLAIVAALALCAAAALFVYAALGEAPSIVRQLPTGWDSPVSDTPRRETFTVPRGASAAEVGEELQRRGLIRSSLAFRWEVESRGVGNKLEAGDYELSPSMSTSEIVAVLARGTAVRGKTFTVLEGWRAEQVAQRAEELGLGKADEILRLVRSPREHGLTPPDPASATLEGFLFPETYEFDPKASSGQIVSTMLRQFERNFTEALRRQASNRGLTLTQVVTLASIVEREAARPNERPVIASVYRNRLAAGLKLEADPTVQYAVASLDPQAAAYGFWKQDLTAQDLQVDSQYNTYKVAGLPPGPICSPGMDSLQAALSPAETGYLYFVARGDGSHAFAASPEEHLANVQRFRPH
jgi:UPF0755 protein